MNKNICFLVFLIGSIHSFGRNQFSYEKEKTTIVQQYDSLAKIYGLENEIQKQRFIKSICDLSASIYTDQKLDYSDQFEDYLFAVAKRLDPAFNHKLHLYKSPYPNAFTIFNGDIFLHWGLIADAESEAGMAYTIGHEIGHFTGAHIFTSFINSQKTSSLNQDEEIKKWHHEQNQEYFSDSLGFELASKAGYSWKSGLTGFYEYLNLDTILSHLEAKANIFNAQGELINDDFYDESSDTLFSSHPPTESRIKLRKRMGLSIKMKGIKNIVSEESFINLQNHARKQVLKSFLENNDYKIGLIKAFKYYCLDPANSEYKYYLLEFLRRKYLGKKRALSLPLFSDVYKLSHERSIYNNLRWIFRTKQDLAIAKRNIEKLGISKENTYNDLLNFLEESQQNESPEFYLSLALFHHKNKVKKAEYIKTYLKYPTRKYNDFAIAFQQNELLSTLRKNKDVLFILQETTSEIITKEGTIRAPKENTDINEITVKKIVVKRLKGQNVVLVNEVNETQNQDQFITNELIPYMYSKIYSDEHAGNLVLSGSSTSQLISPKLWTYLVKNNVASVYMNKNFMVHDKTVSKKQNQATKIKKASVTLKKTTSSNYYGESIHSYLFRLISFNAIDFTVSKHQEWGISKLLKSTYNKELKNILK
jgi:hypothetical protein